MWFRLRAAITSSAFTTGLGVLLIALLTIALAKWLPLLMICSVPPLGALATVLCLHALHQHTAKPKP